jgi:hypothetical protein
MGGPLPWAWSFWRFIGLGILTLYGGLGFPRLMGRPAPRRHWRSDGTEPLPSGAEAMGKPFAAFPSRFLRIECGRCGKVRMVNKGHALRHDQMLRSSRG